MAALAAMGITRPSHIQASAFRALIGSDAPHVVLGDHAGAPRSELSASELWARTYRGYFGLSVCCTRAACRVHMHCPGIGERPGGNAQVTGCHLGASRMQAALLGADGLRSSANSAAVPCECAGELQPETAVLDAYDARAGSGKTLANLAPVAQALRAEEG